MESRSPSGRGGRSRNLLHVRRSPNRLERLQCQLPAKKKLFVSTLLLNAATVQPTMQHPPNKIPLGVSRRAFLKASSGVAAGASLLAGLLKAQSREARGPLMAYVGTFSSPLRDVLPTQVDLPPGNGRGIHLFQVNRSTGAMTPSGVRELGTSPGCLALNAAGTCLYSVNETDRVGEGKEGTVRAFAINRADG